MTLSPESLHSPNDSAILLSVKPKFVDLIMAGSKRVELRRAVPAQKLGTMALYSSSPIQAIVALVGVSEIIETSPSRLWEIARDNGGGLTRAELRSYFKDRKAGFAIILENVKIFKIPVDPKKFFKKFTPPQSFKYLTDDELLKLVDLLDEGKTK